MTAESGSQMKSRMTESDAILRARAGDAEAFKYLYDSHRNHVYSVCMRMLKNSADAEDFTQQAFLQVFRKLGTFRGESRFSTWLHRVAVNTVLMHLLRRKRKETNARTLEGPDASYNESSEPGAADISMLGVIDRINLLRAIRRLPAGYRRLFLMHDVLGLKHSEIAQRLGCSRGCSKSQVHKARKRIRDLLRGTTSQEKAHAVSA